MVVSKYLLLIFSLSFVDILYTVHFNIISIFPQVEELKLQCGQILRSIEVIQMPNLCVLLWF